MDINERRHSVRVVTRIPATVRFKEWQFTNCYIRDYSTSGIFIQCATVDINKESLPIPLEKFIGQTITVTASQITTQACIARITDSGLGATFL